MSVFEAVNPWIAFIICFAGVIVAGWRLTSNAEIFAEKKGLSRGAVGFTLLGIATSLPELITTVSSVNIIGNPALGAGNILGSDSANMFILFFSLLTAETMRNKNRPDIGNIRSVSIFLAMLATLMFGMLLEGHPRIGGVSVYSAIILFLFVFSIVKLREKEDYEISESSKESLPMGKFFYLKLAVFFTALVFFSYELSLSVDTLASVNNWSNTAAGAVFLAWGTSLPELIVTVTAMAVGSLEMGVGNIVGSNIFNLGVLGFADTLSLGKFSVFSDKMNSLMLTALLFLMSAVLIYLLLSSRIKKIFGISFLPAIMMILYVLCIAGVF